MQIIAHFIRASLISRIVLKILHTILYVLWTWMCRHASQGHVTGFFVLSSSSCFRIHWSISGECFFSAMANNTGRCASSVSPIVEAICWPYTCQIGCGQKNKLMFPMLSVQHCLGLYRPHPFPSGFLLWRLVYFCSADSDFEKQLDLFEYWPVLTKIIWNLKYTVI